jgi:hypothetical protein
VEFHQQAKDWVKRWISENARRLEQLPAEDSADLIKLASRLEINNHGEVKFPGLDTLARKLEYGVPDHVGELRFLSQLHDYVVNIAGADVLETAKPVSNKPAEQPSAPAPATNPQGDKPKTNGLAVAALICAFFIPIIGLILGIVALVQIKKSHEGGKGLAIASIVVSVTITLLVTLAVFGSIFAFSQFAKQNGVNIDTKNGSVDVKGKDGESLSIGNAKVPEGFPADVPIYKPSDVIVSLKVKDGYNVTLATNDSSQQVADYYKSELAKNGWTNQDTSAVFNANVAQAYQKGNTNLVIVIGNDQKASNGKQTTVSLTVGTKQE